MQSEIRAVLSPIPGVTFADTEQVVSEALSSYFARWREGESLYHPGDGRAPWLSHDQFVRAFVEVLEGARIRDSWRQ